MSAKPKRTHVKIDNEIYDEAKKKANERGISVQDYINRLVLLNMEKEEFVKQYCPLESCRKTR